MNAWRLECIALVVERPPLLCLMGELDALIEMELIEKEIEDVETKSTCSTGSCS